MGVPGFFAWLWKKYKSTNFVFSRSPKYAHMQHLIKNISRLYLDTNCAIHPVCFKILAENKDFNDYNKLHDKMIKEVIEYIDYLFNYTQPTDLFYISIDGVAPSAKLKQQRSRRFKSIKDKQLFDSIKRKHNKPVDKFWTNSCITPGTKFMVLLNKELSKYCENKKKEYPNLKIIFSTCNTPAEGEHKVLQHIRNNKPKKDEAISIYGLDADLIFLSLSTNCNNIYLLRESVQMGQNATTAKLNFVSVDIMKDCVIAEFNSYLKKEDEITLDKYNVIMDFIFVCYFLGNDFLPNIPSVDIRMYSKELKNGIDLLIDVYIELFKVNKQYIILKTDKIDINLPALIKFISTLAVYEKDFFIKKRKARKYRRRCESKDPYDMEMHKIDNLQFKIVDPVKLGYGIERDWKFKYYDHYFHSSHEQVAFIKEISYEYIIGLYWIANYYFDKCSSWTWYYPFEHSPLLTDLAIHIKTFDPSTVSFKLGKPLEQFEQLLTVLPAKSNFLLPKELRSLMTLKTSKLKHLYPTDYELDMIDKNKYWQCIPNLPMLDVKLIKKEKNKIKVDSKYDMRNVTTEPMVF